VLTARKNAAFIKFIPIGDLSNENAGANPGI
jgi:hypothetical protein